MAYCSETDINEEISADVVAQLTDDSNGTVTDSDNLDAAIAKADSMIDGYLTAQYTLPLSSVPALINTIAIDLTVYYLYKRRVGAVVPEDVVNQYKIQIKTLEKINQNKIKLSLPDEPANTGSVWSSISKTQIYTDTYMDTY